MSLAHPSPEQASAAQICLVQQDVSQWGSLHPVTEHNVYVISNYRAALIFSHAHWINSQTGNTKEQIIFKMTELEIPVSSTNQPEIQLYVWGDIKYSFQKWHVQENRCSVSNYQTVFVYDMQKYLIL